MDIKVGDTIRIIKNMSPNKEWDKCIGDICKVISVNTKMNTYGLDNDLGWRREEIELCNKKRIWI